jgi:anti-sigma regulatory factor (Ser/Thr protein kinase)
LHAGAVGPSRVDSVPATRAFLIRLLQGWSVADEVVESAALLATEIMANALEHGAGLLSVGIALDEGMLHIGVGDKAKERQPEVQALDNESDSGRGMWIVDILASSWGSDPTPGGIGKTVWFELSSA